MRISLAVLDWVSMKQSVPPCSGMPILTVRGYLQAMMDYGQVKHRGRLGMGERGRREIEGWRPLGHYCISNINGRLYIEVQRIQ